MSLCEDVLEVNFFPILIHEAQLISVFIEIAFTPGLHVALQTRFAAQSPFQMSQPVINGDILINLIQ